MNWGCAGLPKASWRHLGRRDTKKNIKNHVPQFRFGSCVGQSLPPNRIFLHSFCVNCCVCFWHCFWETTSTDLKGFWGHLGPWGSFSKYLLVMLHKCNTSEADCLIWGVLGHHVYILFTNLSNSNLFVALQSRQHSCAICLKCQLPSQVFFDVFFKDFSNCA